MPNISVLILTFNEAVNIADCIQSIPWRDDLYVLDSGSDDETTTIARQLDASVLTHRFAGYAHQRNVGLALPFKHEWVVMLDADERMTPQLAREIEERISTAAPEDAMFRVRRRDMFMGRWLRRSSGYPTWFPRVLRRGRVQVHREINELYVAHGKTNDLLNHIDHYPFQKGMEWWFERHNRYSTAEAILIGGRQSIALIARDIFSKDPSNRRAALKALAYSMPARPFLVFFYLYFVRGGFIDGAAGYTFASMRMSYEVMIDAKAQFARAGKNAVHQISAHKGSAGIPDNLSAHSPSREYEDRGQ